MSAHATKQTRHGLLWTFVIVGAAFFNPPAALEYQTVEHSLFGVSVILVPLMKDATTPQSFQFRRANEGVMFDIKGTGTPVKMAWPMATSHVAFLAIDRNHNGAIDDGSELFGAQTFPDAKNGFAALRAIGRPQVGQLADDDPAFAELLLWSDRNENGRSEAAELVPARSVLARIGFGYSASNVRGAAGALFLYQSAAVARADFKGSPDDPIRPLYEVSLPVAR
jgi:hypothetical protein